MSGNVECVLRLLFLLFFSYEMAAFFHEAGHAFFGKLHGGRVLLLRIGRIVWISGGGCFLYQKKIAAPGQCLVVCKNRQSCIQSALGGCLANVLTAFVAAGIFVFYHLICERTWEEWFRWGNLSFFFVVISLLMAVINWFSIFCPREEANDGWLWKCLRSQPSQCDEFLKEQRKYQFLLEEGQIEELFICM